MACRACVRRLNNFSEYRKVITETQRKLGTEDVPTKRCLELPPSLAKPSAKVQATGGSRQRSLYFASAGAPGQSESSLHVSFAAVFLSFPFNFSIAMNNAWFVAVPDSI